MFLKNKITEYAKRLSKRMIITIILTLLVSGYLVVKAAFVEPSAAPADSDQDFAQNILGANNADNDFDSSSVAANRDGSIIEREEHIIDYLSNSGATCGNSIVEYNEGCDDGGTSWTAGACAGDCSRRNYWSEPSVKSFAIGAGTYYGDSNAAVYCQEKGFRIGSSYNTAAGNGSINFANLFNSLISSSAATASASSTDSAYALTASTTASTSFTTTTRWYTEDTFTYTVTTYSYSLRQTITFRYSTYSRTTSSVLSSVWSRGWNYYFTSSLGSTTATAQATASASAATIYSYLNQGGGGLQFSYYYITGTNISSRSTISSSSLVSFATYQPSTAEVISEIWCAD